MESLKKLLLSLLTAALLSGCASASEKNIPISTEAVSVSAASSSRETQNPAITEDGIYDSEEEVALYLETYWRLPVNYMTKADARKEGWNGGALNRTIPGRCIGGDQYSNYEGTLPEAKGRIYYECDIDTLNSSKRGAKRIVWSTDQNIYYTEDHYDTFVLIFGDDSE
ncbi:MAG: ribonuclease [Erysipelotrichia bacterium]|nr:ribonuclease [Erysipelotrichia bacterium]